MHKVEASMRGGHISCRSSAALRFVQNFEETTVYGNVSVEEWTGCPKRFRIVYDGTNHQGNPVNGILELPADEWILRTVKAKSYNAKARLLLIQFANGPCMEIQLTLPIFSHQDSKRTKAVVDSLYVYGAHHIKHNGVYYGKR
jgi:hypothetical protein